MRPSLPSHAHCSVYKFKTSFSASFEDYFLHPSMSESSQKKAKLSAETEAPSAKSSAETPSPRTPHSWFTLTVVTMSGDTFSLEVYVNWTIASIKAKIQEKMSIPVNEQRLILDGVSMKDDETLRERGVWDDCTISLVRSTFFPLEVILYGGGLKKRLMLNVQASDTIDEVKAQIHDKAGVAPGAQELHKVVGRANEDMWMDDGSRTLSSYNVHDGESVVCFI